MTQSESKPFCFCTVITANFMPYARVLRESFARFSDIELKVLVVDEGNLADDKIEVFRPGDLFELPVAKDVYEKYEEDLDRLRWSMKPVFLEYLLSARHFDRVIFIDPDLYFYDDPGFLFEQLSTYSILLAPHWRSSDPAADPVNFERNFHDGIFNGGFIGASRSGIEALRWWSRACLYKCEKDSSAGLFDDQKYLDILHSRFLGVEAIRHKGCNVASWNMVDCQRINVGNSVLINGKDPIVFIHMTKSTMRCIVNGTDSLLQPHLREYQAALNRHRPQQVDFFTDFAPQAATPQHRSILGRLRRKLGF